MSKPKSTYMWDNLYKTIQIIEARIDLISKTTDLFDPQFFSNTMKIFHSNILILSKTLCIWKKHLSFRMGSNHTVHPLMKVSISWKVVFIKDGIIR